MNEYNAFALDELELEDDVNQKELFIFGASVNGKRMLELLIVCNILDNVLADSFTFIVLLIEL